MSTQDIYNYIKVDEDIVTAGQPQENQFQDAAQEGFKTVINLAPLDAPGSLRNEAELVGALGMTYYYIPVAWVNPTAQDFEAFEAAMQGKAEGKTLIHCQANYRVTAFYSLYGLKYLDWSTEQAEEFRARIWAGANDPRWDDFIEEMTEKIAP